MEDDRRETALEQAAAQGDVAQLQQADLATNLDADERAEAVALALQVACAGSHWNAVRYLVEEAGADLSSDAAAGTVLQHAAMAGSLDMLKMAAAHGADLASKAGGLAALSAAINGQLDALRFLVERGADVRAEGGRAAMGAAKAGFWQVADYLLNAGVDLELEGAGAQLLAIAAVRDQPGIVRQLEDRDVAASSPAGALALLHLSSTQEWEACHKAVRYLVEHGADVSEEAGGRALVTASMYGDLEMVEYLVAKGVDPKSEAGGEAVAQAGLLDPLDSGAPVVAFLTGQGAVAPSPPTLVLDEDF